MDDKELAKLLQGPLSTYTGGMFGPSLVDQYRNASAGIAKLDQLQNAGELNEDTNQYGRYKASMRGQQGQAIVGGVITGLGAAAGIANTSVDLASIADTQQYQNQIDDLGRIGNLNYNSYDQLLMDYNRLSDNQPNFSYEDIRGKTDWEKAGGVLSAGLTGASAGMTIGGPLGAAIGGLAGLGAGAIGWIQGDNQAKARQALLNTNAQIANDTAQMNLQAAGERLNNNQHRYQMQNVVAKGGPIRRQETIREFAARALRKPRAIGGEPSPKITRQYCNGGVKIRIKR